MGSYAAGAKLFRCRAGVGSSSGVRHRRTPDDVSLCRRRAAGAPTVFLLCVVVGLSACRRRAAGEPPTRHQHSPIVSAASRRRAADGFALMGSRATRWTASNPQRTHSEPTANPRRKKNIKFTPVILYGGLNSLPPRQTQKAIRHSV